jgi:hypothetical protein
MGVTTRDVLTVLARHKTTHPAIAEAVAADMQSLFQGDLNETISVPMIHSTDNQRLRDAIIPFRSGRGNKTTQTVVIRKMTRECVTFLLPYPLANPLCAGIT